MLSWECYWPEEEYRDLEETVIGTKRVRVYRHMQQSLYHGLRESARRQPDKTALIDDGGKAFSYQELLNLTDWLAEALLVDYSVGWGDHIGILLYNGIDFCIAYLALSKIGAVAVSLPGKFQQPELLSLVEKADISMVICQQKYQSWFAGEEQLKLLVCEPVVTSGRAKAVEWCGLRRAMRGFCGGLCTAPAGRWADDAVFMFTSGTTSQSKAVVMKNYHVMNTVEAYLRTLKLSSEDVTLIATPMYHVTGMICILSVFLAAGGTVHLMKRVDPDRMLECFIRNRVTFYHASPTVFSMLLGRCQSYPDIPSMKNFACGSGNMPPENIRRLKGWMPQAQFHTVYGLTETTGAGTIFPVGAADSPWIGSSGVPMPDLQVKIVDEQEMELAREQIGEIYLKGSFVLESYYRQGKDAITADGWLRTGDLGYYNEAGYLFIVDRKKDMINRGGEKICSFDIENEICTLPGVAEAAVVGVPDLKYMEVPAAAVRLADGVSLTDAAVKAALGERIARFKIPEYVIFVKEIPKNHNGKVDKKRLKEQLKSEGVIWENER